MWGETDASWGRTDLAETHVTGAGADGAGADSKGYDIGPASAGDFDAIARLFTDGFPESVLHVYGGDKPDLAAIAEGFRFIWTLDNGHVQVARSVRTVEVAGYIAVLPSIRGFWRKVFGTGFAARMFFGWVGGKYRLPVRALPFVVGNKLAFVRGAQKIPKYDAQILSIAVRPAGRGLGLGKALAAAGLEHLRAVGAHRVKLEVRPENTPALRTYQRLGFQQVGSYDDKQGSWWVMVKDL